LAAKAAKEDALEPKEAINVEKPALAPDQMELFNVLRTIMSKSNVLELIRKEGASEGQLNAMESMWTNVAQVVQINVKEPKPSVVASSTAISAGGSSANGAVNVPAGHDDDEDMEVDVIEPLWQKHLVENPDLKQLEVKDLEQRKSTFIELQRSIKRSKTSKA